MTDNIIPQFLSGVHNLLSDENIPADAMQDALNWITIDGKIQLAYGKVLVGAEGLAGDVKGLWWGYRTDGIKVLYAKAGTSIRYLNTTVTPNVWTDVVTGLDANDEYKFQNYSSLSGAFTYATGAGGLFKFHNANLGSYLNMASTAANFLGKCLIDKGRMLMYGLKTDPTGLYGSRIDAQNGTVYTTVTGETLATGDGVTTTFSGTLAFKGSNPLANVFGLQITTSPATVSITDNYNGIISGTGVTGTINYLTGAWSLTFTTAPAVAQTVLCTYQWENSNSKGITDFTKSSPRQASEGFILRQDEGGDAIQNVLLGVDGSYYSIKITNIYQLTLDSTDASPTNIVYRKDLGIANGKCAVSTGKGIIFMNTVNPNKPELTRLEKNPLGGNIEPNVLLPQFKWENYTYNDGAMETLGRYLIINCTKQGSLSNDTLLICDLSANTVDITSHGMKSITKDGSTLYGGSPLTQSVYKLLDGFDDDGYVLNNYGTLKGERMQTDRLKKTRRVRLKGHISKQQSYGLYCSYDDQPFIQVATVLGTGTYVNGSSPATVGTNLVGSDDVGGSAIIPSATVFPYFLQIKLKCPKYRKRAWKLVALGFGYVSLEMLSDFDILTFEERVPKAARLKQNVSLDGTQTDLSTPQKS
jgi:hypothetical protein